MTSHIMHRRIQRDLEPRLRHSSRTRPVVVLTGARQTGKTSTLLRLFPDHEYVSLDLPTEAQQADKEPESFLRCHPTPLIVDEVQYAPELFRHIKSKVLGKARITARAVVCRTPNSFPLAPGLRALPVSALE